MGLLRDRQEVLLFNINIFIVIFCSIWLVNYIVLIILGWLFLSQFLSPLECIVSQPRLNSFAPICTHSNMNS